MNWRFWKKEKPQRRYWVAVWCKNCGRDSAVTVPFGEPFMLKKLNDVACGVCGCSGDLHRKPQETTGP